MLILIIRDTHNIQNVDTHNKSSYYGIFNLATIIPATEGNYLEMRIESVSPQ